MMLSDWSKWSIFVSFQNLVAIVFRRPHLPDLVIERLANLNMAQSKSLIYPAFSNGDDPVRKLLVYQRMD